nr:MAG TPA: hypothetical protein [Caudoviricetes sp.]
MGNVGQLRFRVGLRVVLVWPQLIEPLVNDVHLLHDPAPFLWTPDSPDSFTRSANRLQVWKMPVCPGCQASFRFAAEKERRKRGLSDLLRI